MTRVTQPVPCRRNARLRHPTPCNTLGAVSASVTIDRVEAIGRVRAALEGVGIHTDLMTDEDIEQGVLAMGNAVTVFGADLIQVADVLAAVGNALGGRI